MAEVLLETDTYDVHIEPPQTIDVEIGDPMDKGSVITITKNGKHVVSEYDLAEVNVPTRPDDWIAEFSDGTYTYFGNRYAMNDCAPYGSGLYFYRQFGYGLFPNDTLKLKRLTIKTRPERYEYYRNGNIPNNMIIKGLGGYSGTCYIADCDFLDLRGVPWECTIGNRSAHIGDVLMDFSKNIKNDYSVFTKINIAGADFRHWETLNGSFFSNYADWIDATGTKVSETLTFGDFYYIPRIRTLVGNHTLEEVERDKLSVFEGCACDVIWCGGANGPYNRLLNIQSIVAIFNGLADLTGQDSHIVKVGGECNLLTDAQIAIAVQKNWNVLTLT